MGLLLDGVAESEKIEEHKPVEAAELKNLWGKYSVTLDYLPGEYGLWNTAKEKIANIMGITPDELMEKYNKYAKIVIRENLTHNEAVEVVNSLCVLDIKCRMEYMGEWSANNKVESVALPKRYSLILYYIPSDSFDRVMDQLKIITDIDKSELHYMWSQSIDIEIVTSTDYDYVKSQALDFMSIGCGCHIQVKDKG